MRMFSWVCLSFLVTAVLAYKPVVLVHGILSNGGELSGLKHCIEFYHPSTEVFILKYAPDIESTIQLSLQLLEFKRKMKVVMERSPEGFHMICHSQGGLLCLGFMETTPNHNVHSFIVLSSPLFGQYGIPKEIVQKIPILKPFLFLEKELITKMLYTPFFQDALSIANYWRDPHSGAQYKYEKSSTYLPLVMNDPNSIYHTAKGAQKRKRNFLRLKKLVLIGGPDDGVIVPWQSTLFGYYDENAEKIIPMKKQKVFLEDWFGLKTLYRSGRISTYVFPGVKHKKWHSNLTVFKTAIEPWLK